MKQKNQMPMGKLGFTSKRNQPPKTKGKFPKKGKKAKMPKKMTMPKKGKKKGSKKQVYGTY